MTQEEAREAAEVMIAYANGAEIEFRKISVEEWRKVNEPAFDWAYNEYRVKPKSRFDPKTLQPYDKVLMWCNSTWCCDFYSNPYKSEYMCVGGHSGKVIPYNDETKHLIGTSEEAPEYYKYWEE